MAEMELRTIDGKRFISLNVYEAERKRAEEKDREIERLKAENEQYWALAKQHQEALKSSQKALGEMKLYHHNAKEEISRLSASLATALEKLRACVIHFERTLPSQPRPTISELENILKRDQICLTLIQPDGSLTSHPCIEEAKKVLSDPTGKDAHERWKRMWEVITYANTVRNDILIPETDDQVEMSCQCKAWVDGLLERLQALEALEAKGESK